MSLILATSRGGQSGGHQIPLVTVPASSTSVIDSVPTADSRTAKWVVVVTDTTNDKTQAFEILALHKNGTTSTHNMYSILGDQIDFALNVIIVGTDLTLQITNNEAVSIEVDAARIQVLT